MNLATMRDEFKESTSGLADALTDAEIETHLNRFYRYVIPSDVDGSISEILWNGTMNTLFSLVAIPSYIVSLNEPKVWLSGTASAPEFMSVYTDFADFIAMFPDYGSDVGKPTAVCFHGRTAIFTSRKPDQAYGFTVQCRGGPSADLQSAGITDEIHALCVVHGSAWHYLLRKEDEAGAAREGAQYEIFKSMLQTRSTSQYRGRTPARSF